MKKLACVAILGLSFVSAASFADYPPLPTPGVSCKATYDPTKDLKDFCGCYQEQAVPQCRALAAHGYVPGGSRVCNAAFPVLVTSTCGDEKLERGIVNFCKTNVEHLHQSGITSVTTEDCQQDVGYICDSGGQSICSSYWQKSF